MAAAAPLLPSMGLRQKLQWMFWYCRCAAVLGDVGSGKNKGRNFAYKFHVLTVRNRRLKADPDLSDVLAALTAALRLTCSEILA